MGSLLEKGSKIESMKVFKVGTINYLSIKVVTIKYLPIKVVTIKSVSKYMDLINLRFLNIYFQHLNSGQT